MPVAGIGAVCSSRRPSLDTIGPWELLIIVLVIGLLFGADRLPQVARSLGQGIREFRGALHEGSPPSTPLVTQEPSTDSPLER